MFDDVSFMLEKAQLQHRETLGSVAALKQELAAEKARADAADKELIVQSNLNIQWARDYRNLEMRVDAAELKLAETQAVVRRVEAAHAKMQGWGGETDYWASEIARALLPKEPM